MADIIIDLDRYCARPQFARSLMRWKMSVFEPEDIVRKVGMDFDVLDIARADEIDQQIACPSYDCAWEQGNQLFEAVVPGSDLVLVRRERRRVPRGGILEFPKCNSAEIRNDCGHPAR